GAFPLAIGLASPMLDGTAAANAEMRAECCDPVGTRRFHSKQASAIGMASEPFDCNAFPGKCVRYEHRLTVEQRHPVATITDVIDCEQVNHGGRPGRIRDCRR